MKRDKRIGIFVVLVFIVGTVIPVVTPVTAQLGTPHIVVGKVIANATYGVGAYDADPAKNGNVTVFMQNWMNNGTHFDVMFGPPTYPFDIYQPQIGDSIDWAPGNPAVVVVDFQDGAYLSNDRAGYIAFESDILNSEAIQYYADTELKKVPIPQFISNATNFINISWTPLDDPQSLIAGYTVYRSPTNDSDISWTLVSGDLNAPVTTSFFNDTSVAAGTIYHYALKVSFKGYNDNIPANVNNKMSKYFGEGSYIMQSKPLTVVTDKLEIEYLNGTAVTSHTLNVNKSMPIVKAQGYNISTGSPTETLQAEWTLDNSLIGSVNPTNGTQTTFTSKFKGGQVNVTATYGSLTDTFTVFVNPPTIDSIVLTYANGTAIDDGTIWYMENDLDIRAAGYNGTVNPEFIDFVTVDWSVTAGWVGSGTFNPTSGNMSVFHPVKEGNLEIKSQSTVLGKNDTVILNLQWLTPPQIDQVKLTDKDGNDITTPIPIGGQIQIYAFGFNITQGAIVGPVEATWSIVSGGGSIDNTTGLSTLYTGALAGGPVTIRGTNASMQGETIINILPPTADYIIITDAPNGTALTTKIISTQGSVTAYASGYNNTGSTYAGLVVVTWSDAPTNLGDFSVTSGNTTVYTASNTGVGSVIITAEYMVGVTDDFTVEIQTLTTDYVKLTDAPNGGILMNVILNVGGTITIYASGYNDTGGYTELVNVDWSQSPNTIGTLSATTGATSTMFTAGNAGGTTSIIGANTGMGVSESLSLTITPPTVDSIKIRNASGGGGVEVLTDTFTLGGDVTKTYFCAGYNDTAGYVQEVTATWTVDSSIGSVLPVSGTSTQFTASTAGTGNLSANFSGMVVTASITVSTQGDTTPPVQPTGFTVVALTEGLKLKLTWSANTESDLAGYNIYRSTSADSGFVKINTALITDTTYTDLGLTAKTTYYYRITAVDTSDNESPNSTVASATVKAEPSDGDEDDGEFPWIILVIVIIVIIVLLLLFLMMKKKPQEAVPSEEEKELPPPPGGEAEAEEGEAAEEEETESSEEEETHSEEEGEETTSEDEESEEK